MTHDPKKTSLGWAQPAPPDFAPSPAYAPPDGSGYEPTYPQAPAYGTQPDAQPAYADDHTQLAYPTLGVPPAQPRSGSSASAYDPQAHAAPPAYPPYDQHAYAQQAYDQHAYAQQAYPYMPPAPPPPPAHPGYHQQAAAIVQTWQHADAPPESRAIRGAHATAGISDRVRFIRRTYLHLFGAILAFAGLLYLLMTNDFLVAKVSVPLVRFALGGRWNWGVVLAAFMVVSWLADYWASHANSRGMQYVGLGCYVIAEALIFVPLLAIVAWKTQAILARGDAHPNIIRDSAFVTLGIFSALTASVFVTRKDFSFLRSGLAMASGAALMLIVLSLAFGFNLGLVFSVAMVLLAAAYILYQTSQVLAHYHPEQYVAASLALFSSVALMFWYVIRIFLRARE